MSKLSTLLRRVARSEPSPLGFAAFTNRTKNPEMVVAVSIENLDLEATTAAATGGADFILLADGDLERDAEKIKAITSALKVPCGLRVSKGSAWASETARGLGLDFLRIEDDETPAAALLDEELGFVLTIEQDTSDTILRILESMSFDALFAGSVDNPFTIRRQIELRRISGLAHKPLILSPEEELASEDLESLRDSGVAALLLEGDNMAAMLPTVRSAVEAMRPRRRRREDRPSPTPTLPSVAHGDSEEDDEDE